MPEEVRQELALALQYNDDVAGSLGSWMPQAMASLPGWLVAIEAFASEMQVAEDAFFAALSDMAVDSAFGETLDRAGRLVGEQRLGLDDHDFRRFIRARIGVNHSDGSRETVGLLFETMTEGEVRVRDSYPASVFGVAVVPKLFSEAVATRIARAMDEAMSGGVGSGWVATIESGFILSDVGDLGPGVLDGAPLAQVLAAT